ncbi:MAG: T9SS type A sorting domain-containing protein [Bacteroidales bacterium]|nr:T9SS type A sorting domain-containing protein [Bacteroidales bacterium]
MKRNVIIMVMLLFALGVMAQPVLHWRFSNAGTKTVGMNCVFEFDIELACSLPETYHSSTMVYFNYNTLAFGENIWQNGKISLFRLELLDGDPMFGVMLHSPYELSAIDAKPSMFALTSWAGFMQLNPAWLKCVPDYPDFGGYLHVEIIVNDENQPAGIEFVGRDGAIFLMDGSQYYCSAPNVETKYGIPPDYACIYENDLLTAPTICSFNESARHPDHGEKSLANGSFRPESYRQSYDTDQPPETTTGQAKHDFAIYSQQSNIYVYNMNNVKGNVVIYSLMGQVVMHKSLDDGLNVLTLQDANTCYVVKVISNETTASRKVYIR